MQNNHLKLKEIIWEITGQCNNNCKYCGSKDSWAKNWNEETENEMIEISKNIAEYPPEQIDMSGGDPLLVSYETHETIVKILKSSKVVCKIIINPKSLCKKEDISNNNEKILSLYNWIGLSINTEEEIGLLELLVPTSGPSWFPIQKTTIISNFNLQNIFLYDVIEAFVKAHSLTWQVQYTIFKEKDKSLALYENQASLDFFFKKIQDSIKNNIKIVLADNINNGKCGAGLNSLGILYNGDVVPCLSMRSWVEDINSVIVGNILNEGPRKESSALKYIWENGFNKYRFECFKCCKDYCGNKSFNLYQEERLVDLIKKLPNNDWGKYEPINVPSCPPPTITLYGVCPSPTVIMYGCNPQYTQVYAVSTPCNEGTFVYGCKIPDGVTYTTCSESTTISEPKNINKKDKKK